MPLPRSFASDAKRSRTPLQPVVEEDELFENEDDDILAMLERKPTQVNGSNSKQLSDELLMQLNKSLEHLTSNLKRTILDSQNSIVSRISTGQNEQLKDHVSKKAIESLMDSVAQHNEELVNLTTVFKTAMKKQESISTDQRERLSNLECVSNENKSILEDMLAAYERDSMMMRKEQEELLVAKEGISRDRRELEKAEALFEQRRVSYNSIDHHRCRVCTGLPHTLFT